MEKYIVLIAGVIGGVVSFLVDGVGMAVTVLLGMMALDYISGLMSAAYQRKLNSRIGFNGLIRKSYYLLLVGSVYLMATAVNVEGITYAGDGLAIALIVMEFISITENGTKMNLPMPEPVRKILLIVTDKINGNGESK